MRRVILAAALVVASVFAIQAAQVTVVKPVAAHAATYGGRWHAFEYALNQRGCWYEYGHDGPCSSGFDCSGLVYRAYRSAGFAIPRTTYEMLGWWRLRQISLSQIREGDLAFFGSGHVELVRWQHETLGALESGTQVGFHRWYASSSWRPTAFYHVIGAGLQRVTFKTA